MLHSRFTLSAVAALALLAGAAWSPALAEAPSATPQVPTDQAPVTQDKLKSFAVASLEVERISQQYAPKLQAAKTQADQDAVRQEATDKMVDAVQKKGLSVEEYRRIAIAARADPQIARQITTYRQQAH